MSATEESLALLRSIDASLKQLVKHFAAQAPKAIASDRDLDGPHGDPLLKFTVRDWTGPSYKGQPFSACPADLLDLIAESLDYFARKADETDERTTRGGKVGDFKRADAARARGWAKRIRDGKHRPPAAGESAFGNEAAGFGDESGFGDEDGFGGPGMADGI